MNPRRWTTTKKPATQKEKSALQITKALADCRQGKHSLTPTFRPGEHVCQFCSVVLYCFPCLTENDLKLPTSLHAFPLDCVKHQKVQVQA